ncbi:MAG: AAA family ATPase, partial [Lachnospiraceae bacterium]|nr:AAA family ATPase [Lachnospiraceae bacterium]
IIMTSNLGSEFLLNGIADDGSIMPESVEQVNALLRGSFRPEFLNRLDEIIMFKPLTKDDIVFIVDLQVKELNERLSDKEIKVSILPEAKQFIVDNGYDPVYGARPLKRYIQKNVETLVARTILEGKVSEGDTIEISLTEGTLSANCLKKDEK